MCKPDFWKVRLSEVRHTVENVKTGSVETLAVSPGGHPVYAVSYGPEPEPGTSNWSAAMGAGNASVYRDGTTDPQRMVLVGACHGAEMEAVAGLTNLIQILETGRDFAGRDRREIQQLAENYRIVILPCLNPDGREKSPDDMIGRSADEALRINQGEWNDGTAIGYPACKEHQPLHPADCRTLGGYPNRDGYNLMHDATPGDIRTAEARALLGLVAREGADLVLHMHSHAKAPEILPAHHGMYDLHRIRTTAYRRRLQEFFQERGLDVTQIPSPDPAATWLCPVNLATMTTLASGALSPVYEQPCGSHGYDIGYETMLEHALSAVELFLRWGLKEKFSPRMELMYTVFDADSTPFTYRKEQW